MNMAYLIEIEVEHDSGKSPKESIDLASKLQELGINPSQLEETYTASYIPNTTHDPKEGINQQYSWASGGHIFRPQLVIHNNQVKTKKTSFNIIIRFDDKEKMWNIDLAVHIDDPNANINDKRLITKHINGIHKQFSHQQAEDLLKVTNTSIVLSRLKKFGWLELTLDPEDSRKRLYKLKGPAEAVEDLGK